MAEIKIRNLGPDQLVHMVDSYLLKVPDEIRKEFIKLIKPVIKKYESKEK